MVMRDCGDDPNASVGCRVNDPRVGCLVNYSYRYPRGRSISCVGCDMSVACKNVLTYATSGTANKCEKRARQRQPYHREVHMLNGCIDTCATCCQTTIALSIIDLGHQGDRAVIGIAK